MTNWTAPLPDELERVAKDRADWLLDAVAGATQNRQFLRGDPEYDEVAGEAILLNGEKAIRVAIERAYNNRTSAVTDAQLVEATTCLTWIASLGYEGAPDIAMRRAAKASLDKIAAMSSISPALQGVRHD